jgi:hypothetical protein
VDAWVAAIKPEHQAIAKRFDALVGTMLPGVTSAVKWHAPFYGLPGKGWVATFASFKDYVSIGFFAGARFDPPPPEGDRGTMRRVKLPGPEAWDDAKMRAWLTQAGQTQGWGKL